MMSCGSLGGFTSEECLRSSTEWRMGALTTSRDSTIPATMGWLPAHSRPHSCPTVLKARME